METLAKETEIIQYMGKMNDEQKELLLNVAKNFVAAEETPVCLTKEVMDAIWKDREDYMNGIGKNYSWDEVKAEILNKRKKHVSD